MRITFLGTGADTAYPLPFCFCDNCVRARDLGGRNYRKRSSLLINNDLIVDLGPDIMSSSFAHGVNISSAKYWLQTHAHSDHFDPAHLSTRIPEYMCQNVPLLQLYASKPSVERMTDMLRGVVSISSLENLDEQKRFNLKVIPIKPFMTYDIGEYKVTTFETNHDPSVGSLLFAINQHGKTVFYGTDTDALPDKTWETIKEMQLVFDLVILDHTYGPGINGGGHLNADTFIQHIQKMRDLGVLNKDGHIFATHISHEGNPPHEELQRYGEKHGYKIAYDGLIVDI